MGVGSSPSKKNDSNVFCISLYQLLGNTLERNRAGMVRVFCFGGVCFVFLLLLLSLLANPPTSISVKKDQVFRSGRRAQCLARPPGGRAAARELRPSSRRPRGGRASTAWGHLRSQPGSQGRSECQRKGGRREQHETDRSSQPGTPANQEKPVQRQERLRASWSHSRSPPGSAPCQVTNDRLWLPGRSRSLRPALGGTLAASASTHPLATHPGPGGGCARQVHRFLGSSGVQRASRAVWPAGGAGTLLEARDPDSNGANLNA